MEQSRFRGLRFSQKVSRVSFRGEVFDFVSPPWLYLLWTEEKEPLLVSLLRREVEGGVPASKDGEGEGVAYSRYGKAVSVDRVVPTFPKRKRCVSVGR